VNEPAGAGARRVLPFLAPSVIRDPRPAACAPVAADAPTPALAASQCRRTAA